MMFKYEGNIQKVIAAEIRKKKKVFSQLSRTFLKIK